MSALITKDARVLVQGITGRAGTFYTRLAMDYGAGETGGYVGGVTPGKGSTEHLGLPVFETMQEAVAETRADASIVMAPPPVAAAAMIEGIEAGVSTLICVTERVPVLDMVRVRDALRGSETALIGPNSQGVLIPEARKLGVMSTADARPGKIGIAARSASLTSEVVAQLSAAGLGQSTTIGIGGDPIHGIGFAHCLALFRDDPETDAVVLIGELGGIEEEEAADFLAAEPYSKPVIALLVGRHAPEGRRLGHAGTVALMGSATLAQKSALLESTGVIMAASPGDVVRALQKEAQAL